MKGKFMEAFIQLAGSIGSQRHLVAIRDGFIAIIPFVIVGSMAILINNFPPLGQFDLVAFLNNIFGEENWQTIGEYIWKGTFAIIGILIAFSVAYNLARSYDIEGLPAGLISVAAYTMLVPRTPDEGLELAWLGSQGIFVAIILALLLTELTRVLIHSGWTIKLPEGVPNGVSRSFKALVPTVIILVLVGLFQTFLNIIAETSIFEMIFFIIQKPLQGLGNTLTAAVIIAFLNHVLWFFGLHGTNILGPVIEPLYLPLIQENVEVWKSGISAFDVPNLVTKPFFDSFVYMGGAGTTIALLTAIFIVVRHEKSHPYREIAKFSVPSSIFNINEPVIFGLPIVLNPVMFIPFVLAPVILTIISYTALAIGFVPKTVAMLPWTTPPFISGYLVTGGNWRGIALQVVNLAISTLIYIPFIMAGLRTMKRKTHS